MRMFIGFFIPALLGFFAFASAQLPPEIIADKYLMQAEQLHAKKDYVAALNMIDKAIALQKEHNLTLPDEFHFKYAQVALAADSTRIALESATKYLSATGRGGEFYKEALALLIEAEGIPISAEETCAGKPLGSSCWMALAGRPECYVWNPYFEEGETVTWSGRCSGNVAQGEGTITWDYIGGYSYNPDTEKYDIPVKSVLTSTGVLQKGIMHGKWVERDERGTAEGPYVNGKKHGLWVDHHASGYKDKGEYIDGKREGRWLVLGFDRSDNLTCWSILYRQGEEVGSNELDRGACQW